MVQTLQNKRSFWHTWPQHPMRYDLVSGIFYIQNVMHYLILMVTIVVSSAC